MRNVQLNYCRRQESMYQMTGLYSETSNGDDGSISTSHDEIEDQMQKMDSSSMATLVNRSDNHQVRSCTAASANAEIVATANSVQLSNPSQTTATAISVCGETQLHPAACSTVTARTTITTTESTTLNHHGNYHNNNNLRVLNDTMDEMIIISQDCGLLSCRPVALQRFARIKIFVLLLSILVTLQQALSSGYINSVITTIEKRFEIPSSFSGLIASSYEIGNVITVIFVSYLGSRRHIPVWIGIGNYNIFEILIVIYINYSVL